MRRLGPNNCFTALCCYGQTSRLPSGVLLVRRVTLSQKLIVNDTTVTRLVTPNIKIKLSDKTFDVRLLRRPTPSSK